jgi:hypothetical protein
MTAQIQRGFDFAQDRLDDLLGIVGIDYKQSHFISPVINGKNPMKFVDAVWFTLNRIMAIAFILTFVLALVGVIIVIVEHFVCKPDQESLVTKVKRNIGEAVQIVEDKMVSTIQI